MKKHVAFTTPAGRLTILAALLAGLSTSAIAAPADLVISHVYGGGASGGATYNRDFIEVFNRGSVAVSLKGKSLQYASATGAGWSSFGVLPDVTLQPGQYYLVAGSAQSSGADIGPIDHNWNMSLAATAGAVALANTTTQLAPATEGTIIDLVGYGTASRRETAAAPAPSTANSIQRAAAGCTDTDNNAADFTAGPVPLPRRSTTPLNDCTPSGPVLQEIVTSCPASLAAEQGVGGSAALSARDGDSIVNSIVIESGAVPGIVLDNVVLANAAGATASATLRVNASVAAGSYPVKLEFGNSDGQRASCTVAVRVAGLLTIPQIQGAGAKTAYNNTVQTTQGVVTALVGSGFFIQDAGGDGDVTTSDGIFVFGSSAGLAVGDLVRVSGTITEYTPTGATRSYTEFKDISPVTKLGTGYSIAPTNVEMPPTWPASKACWCASARR